MMAKIPGIKFVQARHIGNKYSTGNPIGLVLHRTVGSYKGVYEGFRIGNKDKSAHFLIGKKEGEVVQMVDTDTIAYHVGTANSFYLGIEFESIANRPAYEGKFDPHTNADPLTDFQILMGIHIISWICRNHKIPPVGPPSRQNWRKCGGKWNGVLGHADVSGDTSGIKFYSTTHGDTIRDFLALGVLPPDIFR